MIGYNGREEDSSRSSRGIDISTRIVKDRESTFNGCWIEFGQSLVKTLTLDGLVWLGLDWGFTKGRDGRSMWIVVLLSPE